MSIRAYRTLSSRGQDEFIVNKSRFIGIGVPVCDEDEALGCLKEITAAHPGANHHCFAYIIGANSGIMRYSDDGEPGGTAGMPIIEVMKAHAITDALVVVVRYFGGVLLGAGGLTRAYAQGAKAAVLSARVCVMEMTSRYLLEVPYALFGKIEHFLKKQRAIVEDKTFGSAVVITLRVRNEDAEEFIKALVSEAEGAATSVFIDETFFGWRVEG